MNSLTCSFCEKEVSTFVLPCLHSGCRKCLQEVADNNHLGSIVACLKCETKVPVSKEGVLDGLKLLQFSINDVILGHMKGLKLCHSVDLDSEENIVNVEFNDVGKFAAQKNLPDKNGTQNDHRGDKIEHLLYPCNSMDFKEYCFDCDVLVCSKCLTKHHHGHNTVSFVTFVENKKSYIHEMLRQLKKRLAVKQQKMDQVEYMTSNMAEALSTMEKEIEERALYICELVLKKKEVLINRLNNMFAKEKEFYEQFQSKMQHDFEEMNAVVHFTDVVMKSGTDFELMNIHNELSGKLSSLLQKSEEALQLLNMKLDIPDYGKEEIYLNKLYGGIIEGDIVCGNADLLSTIKCDLSWPVGMVVASGCDYVVAGKNGAHDQEGRVLSYNRKGEICFVHKFSGNVVPCDVCHTKESFVLVSTSDGNISSLSETGMLLNIWKNVFNGGGKMTEANGLIYISSAGENAIHVYNTKGVFQHTILLPMYDNEMLNPVCIAVSNTRQIAVTCEKLEKVFLVDNTGCMQHVFESGKDTSHPLVCPSALTFDAFNNLLVADFTSDSIHLISNSGHFLGCLLSTEHGISCPNAMAFDHDGHLLIAQYGGDVQIYRYLSYAKQT